MAQAALAPDMSRFSSKFEVSEDRGLSVPREQQGALHGCHVGSDGH